MCFRIRVVVANLRVTMFIPETAFELFTWGIFKFISFFSV